MAAFDVTRLCLELKHPEHAPGIEQQLVAELERGRLGADRVLIQSFSGPWRGGIDEELIEAARRRGLALHVFTVNEPTELAALVSLGVDGIVTDFPDRLERVLSGFVGSEEMITLRHGHDLGRLGLAA